jgi:6-phosphogluconolactonase
MTQTRWIAVADVGELRRAACGRILDAAARAIAKRGAFAISLAGGNTPRDVYAMLRAAATDWSRWHIYFGDERCAPREDPERNSRMAREAWLDHVPIPPARIHEIAAELGPEEGAAKYAQALRTVGDFDLALLGLGEDGHTASLFPGHDWGDAPGAPDAIAVLEAPKPPPKRISLSASRLSRSREVLFLVAGESKRDAVAKWRSGANIPARAIRPPSGVDVLVEASLLG